MTTPNARRPPTRGQFFMVAISLVVGFLLPMILALGPAAGGGESRMTGAALLGWGIGWGMASPMRRVRSRAWATGHSSW